MSVTFNFNTFRTQCGFKKLHENRTRQLISLSANKNYLFHFDERSGSVTLKINFIAVHFNRFCF